MKKAYTKAVSYISVVEILNDVLKHKTITCICARRVEFSQQHFATLITVNRTTKPTTKPIALPNQSSNQSSASTFASTSASTSVRQSELSPQGLYPEQVISPAMQRLLSHLYS